jgi:hypothetical protein
MSDVRCLSEVQEKEVRWIWERRIPAGKITGITGDPAAGKSTVLADTAARVTRGWPMPDEPKGTVHRPGAVIVLAAEDDVEDTLKARFRAAGADLSLVHVVSNAAMSFPSHIDNLAKLVGDLQAVLVIIDPIEAHLDESVKVNSNPQVRRALQPLQRLASETDAAIVMVRHLRKAGGKAAYAGAGSIAFNAVARAELLVGQADATGIRTLASSKASLGPKPTSLSFELRPCDSVAVVKWLGPVTTVADDLTEAPGEMSALEEACEFLRVELALGWVSSRFVKQQALDSNISEQTLRRARVKLGVRSVRGSMLPSDVLGERKPENWYLALPVFVAQFEQGIRNLSSRLRHVHFMRSARAPLSPAC